MIAWAVTDLPEPDSPSTASVSPARTEYSTPLTALATPSRVRNSTCRSRTSSRGASSGPGGSVGTIGAPALSVAIVPPPQRSLGSRASRTASPSMMNASTVRLSAPAGHSSMCGALRMELDASEMSIPQETVGGLRPTPR